MGTGITLLGVPYYIGFITKGALMILGVTIIAISKYRLARSRRQ